MVLVTAAEEGRPQQAAAGRIETTDEGVAREEPDVVVIVMRADHWHYSLVVFFGIFLFPLAALIDYATTPDPLATILGSTNFSDGQLTADIRSTLEEQGLKLAPNIRVRSKRDQWQLQEQKLRFSFTFIESEIIPSLNNRLITTDLRQLFADNKHTLPSDIQVQVQKKGQKWLLESGSIWYLLKNEGDQIRVPLQSRWFATLGQH